MAINVIEKVNDIIPQFLRGNAETTVAFLREYYNYMASTGSVSGIQSDKYGEWDEGIRLTNIPTTGGSGTGLTVDLNVDGENKITSISINKPGIDYTIGDKIYILNLGLVDNIIEDDYVFLDTNTIYDKIIDPSIENNRGSFFVTSTFSSPSYVLQNTLKQHEIPNIDKAYVPELRRELAKVITKMPSFAEENTDIFFSILTDIYKTRGTFESAKLFFRYFFDTDVEVRNSTTPNNGYCRYEIEFAPDPEQWLEFYLRFIHPCGFLLILITSLEIVVKNNPEGSALNHDLITRPHDPDWLNNFVTERGCHFPRKQPGFIGDKELIIKLIEVLNQAGIRAQSNLLNEGNYDWEFGTGLNIVQPDETKKSRCVGNVDDFYIVDQAISEYNETDNQITNDAPVYLRRDVTVFPDEIEVGSIIGPATEEFTPYWAGVESRLYHLECDYEEIDGSENNLGLNGINLFRDGEFCCIPSISTAVGNNTIRFKGDSSISGSTNIHHITNMRITRDNSKVYTMPDGDFQLTFDGQAISNEGWENEIDIPTFLSDRNISVIMQGENTFDIDTHYTIGFVIQGDDAELVGRTITIENVAGDQVGTIDLDDISWYAVNNGRRSVYVQIHVMPLRTDPTLHISIDTTVSNIKLQSFYVKEGYVYTPVVPKLFDTKQGTIISVENMATLTINAIPDVVGVQQLSYSDTREATDQTIYVHDDTMVISKELEDTSDVWKVACWDAPLGPTGVKDFYVGPDQPFGDQPIVVNPSKSVATIDVDRDKKYKHGDVEEDLSFNLV